MRTYLKELPVEHLFHGVVIEEKVLLPAYPIMQWWDESGILHSFPLFDDDVIRMRGLGIKVEEE